jgi:hypothetical protein
MVFCDTDDLRGLVWLKGCWVHDGKYVEVSRDDVVRFLRPQSWRCGEQVIVTTGFLRGQKIRIKAQTENGIDAVVEWANGLETPVELDWLTPDGDLSIK